MTEPTTDDDIATLERLIAERDAGLMQLGIVDRILARGEIDGLRRRLESLRSSTSEDAGNVLADVPDDVPTPEPESATAAGVPAPSGHRGMPFVVCFLQRWRPGWAAECTFCRQPFGENEIYLRGELYTTEARRWRWISLHEDCVLQHATLQQYFALSREDDFHQWFREQERLRDKSSP